MIQEDKELLLKDLCARLPYGVIVRHADYLIDSDGNYTKQFWYKRGYLYNICRLDNMTTTIIESEGSDEEGYEHICDLERSIPYLRPMSSMTEDERKELKKLCEEDLSEFAGFIKNGHGLSRDGLYMFDKLRQLEFCLSRHFDYHGLIEKGVALEAPEGMYKFND